MSFCLMFGSCNREWSGAYVRVGKARDNLRVNPNDYQEYFYYDAYQCGKW